MARDYGVEILENTEKALFGGHPPVLLPVTLLTSGSEVTLERGTVLGKITASGKFTGLDPDGVDGSEVAAAVLAEDVIVGAAADENALALFHGDVVKSGLVWTHVGITEGEQTAAYAELFSAGIFAR